MQTLIDMSFKALVAVILVGFVKAIAFAVVYAVFASVLPIPGLFDHPALTTAVLVLVVVASSALEAHMVRNDLSRIGPIVRMVGRGRVGWMTIGVAVVVFAIGLTWTLLSV